MRPIALIAASAAAALLIASPTLAKDIAADTASAVRAADTAFAARAQVVPTAQAFREFMDETDGLQFDGSAPIRGASAIYEFMGGNKPPRSRLEWRVTDAWGSKGGDMGVTTGLWKSTSLTGARPPVTGRYVTVWRRNAKGQWKGLIDIGNPDAPPQPAVAAAPATPPPVN